MNVNPSLPGEKDSARSFFFSKLAERREYQQLGILRISTLEHPLLLGIFENLLNPVFSFIQVPYGLDMGFLWVLELEPAKNKVHGLLGRASGVSYAFKLRRCMGSGTSATERDMVFSMRIISLARALGRGVRQGTKAPKKHACDPGFGEIHRTKCGHRWDWFLESRDSS